MNFADKESAIKRSLVKYHKMLPANDLVSWTSGNISYYDADNGLVYIKPSGVHYDDLQNFMISIITIDGDLITKNSKPSTDVWTHLHIYNNWPDEQTPKSIVHTHSPYATAFAAKGLSIPCCLTSIADEFGGDIPCGDLMPIGGSEIGQEIIRLWRYHKCRAVLLESHGVFTVGGDIEQAVKAAVMVEDAARIVYLSSGLIRTLPDRLSASFTKTCHDRYNSSYGQDK